MADKQMSSGLYEKYQVKRQDGRDDVGDKHYACSYFVLDLKCDPHAKAAIRAYADSCLQEKPELANDLLKFLENEAQHDESTKAEKESG